MNQFNRTEYLAHQQHHPKRPILKWQVKLGSAVLYENTSVQLCYYYISVHNLKTSPKPCYK